MIGLDQQIEQLQSIVEALLDLCKVTQNGMRCTLPANHGPAEPHQFPGERFYQSFDFPGSGWK